MISRRLFNQSGVVLTGCVMFGGFSTPAGHIGPRFEVGHDISLLIPEVFCRMGPEERDPENLIAAGMLEALTTTFTKGKISRPADSATG